MNKDINFEINDEGIARINFDLHEEKVNKLSSKILSEISDLLDDINENTKIKALIFSSNKKGVFVAGADISEIKDIKEEDEANEKVTKGQNILNKISNLPFPTISFINGACLGGGLELALACKYRVTTDNHKVKIGLPEVNLGIIPGFGGTQRLPKLVGLAQSLNMILSGKAIDGNKAYKIGLVDKIFREEFSESLLNNFLEDILYRPRRNKYLLKREKARKSRLLGEIFGKKLIFKYAKKNLLQKTKGNYPAPLCALEVIKKTYHLNCSKINKGLEIEAKEFSKLAISQISKNLIDIFFINEEIKKDNYCDNNIQLPEIKDSALIGAGIMGGGIAWLFSRYDISLRMKDISNNALALGFKQVYKIYSQLKKIRKFNDNQINNKISNISSTLTYDGFSNCNFIVEAVIEDLKIKQSVLSEVEKHVNSDAIIVSNTSSLDIDEMAKSLKNKKRFAGMHFFNPVNRMPLVEVIKGKDTSQETIASIVSLSKKLGKTPIVVKNVAGFLVNRILIPYINEAGILIEEGGDIEMIDNLVENFGMPMGPFVLADNVGIDVGFKVAKILEESYGERMKVCDLLEDIAKDKNMLGKKSGQGFYIYNNGKKLEVNKAVINLASNNKLEKKQFFDEDLIDRCIYIMINEAAKCIEENVVKNAQYLDMAMIMGAGFPAFRGGILKYADNIGLENVLLRMEKLHNDFGKRFEPSKLLVQLTKKNKKFYENFRD